MGTELTAVLCFVNLHPSLYPSRLRRSKSIQSYPACRNDPCSPCNRNLHRYPALHECGVDPRQSPPTFMPGTISPLVIGQIKFLIAVVAFPHLGISLSPLVKEVCFPVISSSKPVPNRYSSFSCSTWTPRRRTGTARRIPYRLQTLFPSRVSTVVSVCRTVSS